MKSLARGSTETLSSWDAAKARARQRKEKEAAMSDVTETPDLGINPEPDDEELPEDEAVAATDEEWEASAQTQVVDDEAAPESEELADADDEDELVQAEAEVDAGQPDETPAEAVEQADDGEGDDDPVADVTEVEKEEEKPKRKRGGKGKGKGKGKAKAAEKPKRSRDPNSRERGALALDVKSVTDAFDEGDIELEDGQTLTPHRIANLIKDRDGLEKAPSTGAVTNVIKKWEEVGYCLTSESPFAYRRVSAKGKKEGLDALLEKDKERKKKERAKAKADAAA